MSILEQTIPAGTWQLDPVHSAVSWSVKHSGIATFRGTFSDVQAELVDGVLTGQVSGASVDVPVEQLKGHLLAPDFFDAEANPTITFRSTKLDFDGDRLVLEGELTLRLGPGEDEIAAPAGTLVVVPPLVIHAYRNASDGDVVFLNVHAPGTGFAPYLRALRDGAPHDFDQHAPPEDGGRPASEAIVTLTPRPGVP
jgi:hypothetical protein